MNLRTILPLSVALIGSACSHSSGATSSESKGITERQAAPPVLHALGLVPDLDQDAVDGLAQSFCDQQRACSQVGPDRQYSDFDACMTQMRGTTHDDLAALHCVRGLDSAQTAKCRSAILGGACEQGFATLPAVVECRGERLCAK
jgi:hypothetical protein